MKTRIILGHKLTLEAGKRYIAARPMARRGMKWFPVNITTTEKILEEPLLILEDMSLNKADLFLAAFNNGAMSFEGRTW